MAQKNKCLICGKKAVLLEPRFCREHLFNHLRKKAEDVLSRINRIEEKRILIAVSGGKDSSSLAFILKDFDFEKEMAYINLGIPNYSESCLNSLKSLSKLLKMKLNVINLSDYDFTMKDVYELFKMGKIKEKVCSVCGTVKRYLLNKFAWENGFDYVATAHNLDDVAALTAMGVASGNFNYPLEPISPPREELKMAGKVKPFFYVREKELLVFSLVNKIPICLLECDYSRGNTQLKVKKSFARFPLKNFGRNLVKLMRKVPKKEPDLKTCKVCGYATSSSSGICKFCRVKNLISESKK